MAIETKYICTGGCGGEVTKEEFEAGETTCGTEGCPHHGKTFEQRLYCTECKAFVEEGHSH